MNYNKLYNSIIDKAKERGGVDGYSETHHIKPKCMGGTNEKSNLVNLTAREHFIAHWLLYKIHKTKSLAYAWHLMHFSNEKYKGKRYNSHSYQYTRNALSKTMKGNPGLFLGNVHTDDSKRRISETLMLNAARGSNHYMFGKEVSDETKKKMSIAHAKIKPMTCPHCGKVGKNNMKRYHFDKCKHRE